MESAQILAAGLITFGEYECSSAVCSLLIWCDICVAPFVFMECIYCMSASSLSILAKQGKEDGKEDAANVADSAAKQSAGPGDEGMPPLFL